MVPPIYPVTAAGMRPVKMELPNAEWYNPVYSKCIYMIISLVMYNLYNGAV